MSPKTAPSFLRSVGVENNDWRKKKKNWRTCFANVSYITELLFAFDCLLLVSHTCSGCCYWSTCSCPWFMSQPPSTQHSKGTRGAFIQPLTNKPNVNRCCERNCLVVFCVTLASVTCALQFSGQVWILCLFLLWTRSILVMKAVDMSFMHNWCVCASIIMHYVMHSSTIYNIYLLFLRTVALFCDFLPSKSICHLSKCGKHISLFS